MRLVIIVIACLSHAGCAALLPRGRTTEVSRFDSYEAARAAFERAQPYRTTLEELRVLGFDAGDGGANVRQIPYPQLVSFLVPDHTRSIDDLDVGIRECIAARQRCRAYVFRLGVQVNERRGSFLADFLNFKRVTQTLGWRFEGLLLARDDVVMFRSHGGEARIDIVDERRNPLGPLQTLGEPLTRNAALNP